jgi:hypothetical protein
MTTILSNDGVQLIYRRVLPGCNTVKQVIVPYHKGKQLPLGTLRSIIEGSGIPVEIFK